MKKIAFIMNVDWNWIKQRPHFVAEKMSKKADLIIIYQFLYGRKKLQKRSNKNLNLKPIYVIPKLSGIKRLKFVNDVILSFFVKKNIRKHQSDIIFTTYPTQVDMIPSEFDGEIYYDCMDNHVAFLNDEIEKKKLELKEKRLIEVSKKVFVSSDYLKKEISHRYQIDNNKFVLIRNAYDGKIIETNDSYIDRSVIKLAYIGTISSWFDFDTILQVLDSKTNVELHLYGPVDKVTIPNNFRIIYHGVIEHSKLYETIKNMDCLVMPFVLNEIIEAVDPVKVYEYVNFNKNIIIRKYPEVERLKDFVYFYNNSAEFIDAIDKIEQSRTIKYSMKQRTDFLKENSWENRVAIISKEMGL